MIVADPIHEVEELPAPKLGVEDLVSLELVFYVFYFTVCL